MSRPQARVLHTSFASWAWLDIKACFEAWLCCRIAWCQWGGTSVMPWAANSCHWQSMRSTACRAGEHCKVARGSRFPKLSILFPDKRHKWLWPWWNFKLYPVQLTWLLPSHWFACSGSGATIAFILALALAHFLKVPDKLTWNLKWWRNSMGWYVGLRLVMSLSFWTRHSLSFTSHQACGYWNPNDRRLKMINSRHARWPRWLKGQFLKP